MGCAFRPGIVTARHSHGICARSVLRSPHRSLPPLGVAVVERLGWSGHHAEEQSGRVAHDPPGVHLLDPLGAEAFQPAHFGVQVIGVDIEMHPGRTIGEPLDEQADVLAGELDPVVFGMAAEPGRLLAGSWPAAALQNAISLS